MSGYRVEVGYITATPNRRGLMATGWQVEGETCATEFEAILRWYVRTSAAGYRLSFVTESSDLLLADGAEGCEVWLGRHSTIDPKGSPDVFVVRAVEVNPV